MCGTKVAMLCLVLLVLGVIRRLGRGHALFRDIQFKSTRPTRYDTGCMQRADGRTAAQSFILRTWIWAEQFQEQMCMIG